MKTIGVLLYPNVQPMDAMGPWEVLAMWQEILAAPIELMLVAEHAGKINCDNHIQLWAHKNFADCPQLDYLIVPGGRGRREQINNVALIDFIKQQAKSCEKVLSVCTGAFLLYQAGLLKNQHATTYWRALPELKQLPDIHIIEQRLVKNTHIWLAGGVTSGIDLALELIKEIADEKTAGQVQLLLEYFPNHTLYASQESCKNLPPYNQQETKQVAEYMQAQLCDE